MPEFHSEPYLHLAGLTHKSALIAWGAFYFRIRNRDGDFKLVDDHDLKHVHPPRSESIGARSAPYGDVLVEVFDDMGGVVAVARTAETNHCWIHGLAPDTEYTYRVTVDNEVWASGERRDWVSKGEKKGLLPIDGSYDNRFRTFPAPTEPLSRPFTFAVIGDFGRGIRKPSSETSRQREIADALLTATRQHDVRLILTTGDNIYAQRKFFGIPAGTTGDEDDDWFFSYYQPYRYIINRIPVFPCIGNHDGGESEDHDDRGQLFDNFYLAERTAGDVAAGRASIGPGLFYQFRCSADLEFLCIDTSKEDIFHKRLFLHPNHAAFLESALQSTGVSVPRWRIPFSHHPPYSAGPRHRNTTDMSGLVERFKAAGVRAVFSGHEHNFQHSRVDGIDYFLTGGAGEIRTGVPDKADFAAAHTVSWASECHFLLVTVEEQEMRVRAMGELRGGEPSSIIRRTPAGEVTDGPVVVIS